MAYEKLPTELWIDILSYLPFNDLRQARLVCKQWRDIIATSHFMEKSKITITPDNLARLVADIGDLPISRGANDSEGSDDDSNAFEDNFGRLSYRFHAVEIANLSCCDELHLVLDHLGPYIRVLQLTDSAVFECVQPRAPNVEKLKLRRLYLSEDIDRLQTIDLNHFRKLKALDFASSEVEFAVKIICLYQIVNNRQQFQMEELNSDFEPYGEFESLLIQFLEIYAENLKVLRLDMFMKPERTLDRWGQVLRRMKSLEIFQLHGTCCHPWLQVVYYNLPPEAPLTRMDLSGLLHLNDSMLQYIVQKWSSTIQALELMFCHCLTDEGMRELAVLRKTLRKLDISYCRHISGSGLVEGLVREENPVLQYLSFNYLIGFREDNLCVLSERLPNLRVLKLESCSTAVTQKTLAMIFRNQLKLSSLVLNDCKLLTDNVLLGSDHDPTTAVTHLKGLKSLHLRGCHNLTNEVLKNIRFPELRKLLLGYSYNLSTDGVSHIALNCPTVESLTITSCPMLTNESVLAIVANLKRLRRLNISCNQQLTEGVIAYIIEHCERLEELHICGIGFLEKRKKKILENLKEKLPMLKVYM